MAAHNRARADRIGSAARWAPTEVTDLDPRALQQRAGSGAEGPAVWVGPGSVWANPFDVAAEPHSLAVAVARYAVWLAGRADLLAAARAQLGGRDLACSCPLDGTACHRDVLLDVVNPVNGGGRAMALTLRRPWASLMLVPEQLNGKTVENRSWATDYRGVVLLYAGIRVDTAGVSAAQGAGLDAGWHTKQSGWLGAAVLVDGHPARGRCCSPWGHPQCPDKPCYHWVFTGPARLALPTWGRGFLGLRAVSWSVLVRRSALGANTNGAPR
jgi:hypothetical protein